MSVPIVSRIAIVVALALLASSASAQSLADVARQEEARRAAVKAAARAKVLTNADLAPDPRAAGVAAAPSESTAPAPPPGAATASANPGNVSAGAVVAAAPPDAKPKQDEAAWRLRAADLRGRVAKAQKVVDDFTNGTPAKDPREQARVDVLKKRAQDTLTRAEDALRLLIMQADVAGVPPAWVQ